MVYHDFKLITIFEENKWYSIQDSKKNCPTAHLSITSFEHLIEHCSDDLNKIPTYWGNSIQPGVGMDESGITIFPPESLSMFFAIVSKVAIQTMQEDFCSLSKVIQTGIEKHQYLIHFGI